MRYGRLYLLGDAAHLISPMSAEGMSLALHDAEVLARAVVQQIEKDDPSLLDRYSETCLSHTWARQAAAVRMTETMHDSGDASYEGSSASGSPARTWKAWWSRCGDRLW